MRMSYKKPMHSIKRVAEAGFTLIELMVCLVILGIMLAIIMPKIMHRPDQARAVKAKEDIQAISSSLDMYKLDNGFYPSTAQGLKALVKKPGGDPKPDNYATGGYLRNLPKDPWHHPYHFTNPGQHGDVDIYTYGATNQPGGKGLVGEIGNWSNDKSSSS